MTGVFLIVMLLILGRVLHLPRQVVLLMVGILWVGMLSLQVIAPGSGVATAASMASPTRQVFSGSLRPQSAAARLSTTSR